MKMPGLLGILTTILKTKNGRRLGGGKYDDKVADVRGTLVNVSGKVSLGLFSNSFKIKAKGSSPYGPIVVKATRKLFRDKAVAYVNGAKLKNVDIDVGVVSLEDGSVVAYRIESDALDLTLYSKSLVELDGLIDLM